jgi:CRISPR-associated protein Cmr2
MGYLLAFHLGPVQDFISMARRTQDWWMGSWLLSHLTRTAIESVQTGGGILVVPKGLPPVSALAATPNHFLARIASNSPCDVAGQAEEAVRDKWGSIADTVKNQFFSGVDQHRWNAQIESFLEVYWVVVEEQTAGSAVDRKRAQDALDARKRLRDFADAEELDLKCVLCGARQELSGEKSASQARNWWKGLTQAQRTNQHKVIRVREDGSERLCAVCAVKRAALAADALKPTLNKDDGHFPSTSSVAAAVFKKQLLVAGRGEAELKYHFETLRQLRNPAQVDEECLPELHRTATRLPHGLKKQLLKFDGDLFYAETFTEKRLREEYPNVQATLAEFGAESLRALYRAVSDDDPAKHIPPPSKYFAALMMDGDHMGEFFAKASEQQAKALSQALSEFATDQALKTVEQHLGRLVYAGGDDALALLPLEMALPCAQALQQGFRKAVLQSVSLQGLRLPTPSIGIAIGHHTAPLEGLLLAMQQAEKSAKNAYGRDALCVHVLKRSGEEVRVGAHWQAGGQESAEVVTQLVELLNKRALSMKFPTAVAEEARFLPGSAIGAELRRLADRQKGEKFEPHKGEVEGWVARASGWASAIHLEDFERWVLLARFIASRGREGE